MQNKLLIGEVSSVPPTDCFLLVVRSKRIYITGVGEKLCRGVFPSCIK